MKFTPENDAYTIATLGHEDDDAHNQEDYR